MTKMSWIRSSKSAALVVLLALSLTAVGSAGAISVAPGDAPEEVRVGETVTTTVTIEDPFVDMPDQWTLQGSTELENVSLTVTVLQQGDQVDQTVYGEQSFEQELDASNGGDTIEVEITGDAPAVSNYTYEPRETFTLYELASMQGSSTSELNASEVHHYTNASRDARLAIEDAEAAINETGGNSEAEAQRDRAVSAYENSNFDNAESLAGDAQSQAEQAQQSAEQTQTLLMGAGALLVVLLVGGGIYYWRANQDEPTKLQ
jgi:DNA-binding protein YbaB